MKRVLTVGYLTDGHFRFLNGIIKPQIRLSNYWLLVSGFTVGSKISVEFGEELITIRKIKNEQSNNDRENTAC